MRLATRHPSLAPYATLLAGLALRLFALDWRSMWYDEAFAVLFSEKGPARMLYGTLTPVSGAAADVHPILYYTSLWLWMKAVGESPFAARFLSVLLGIVTLALAYRLARELFGRSGALASLLFVSLAPFHVHYSQETRMYSLLAGWLVAATWVYWRALRQGGWRHWASFSVLAALAQYTHNLAALFLVPLALTPIWRRDRANTLRTAAAGIGAMLVYSPWLVLAPSQLAKLQQSYWTQRPGSAELVRSLIAFLFNLPLPPSWLPVALAVALGAFSLAGYQLLRAYRLRVPGAARAAWLMYLGLAPVLLMFAVSQWQPVYIERAMLPASLILLMGLGWGLTQAGMPRWLAGAVSVALLTVASVGLWTHYSYSSFPNSPFRDLDRFLAGREVEGARIIHSNKLSLLPAVYYNRGLRQSYIADPAGSGSDTLALPTQEVLGLLAEPDMGHAAGDAATVYFVIFERAIAEYRGLGEPTHPHLAWLEANFELRSTTRLNDLLVYEFSR